MSELAPVFTIVTFELYIHLRSVAPNDVVEHMNE
jgi:hypothetical protein